MSNLILILGDQLSHNLSSLKTSDKSQDRILMCEVWDEATYVKHHKKKIALLFSAMRHFAEELSNKGWQVDYIKLDDDKNSGSFQGEIERALSRHDIDNIVITEPAEYRVMDDAKSWSKEFGKTVEILPDDRFIATHKEFEDWKAASGITTAKTASLLKMICSCQSLFNLSQTKLRKMC